MNKNKCNHDFLKIISSKKVIHILGGSISPVIETRCMCEKCFSIITKYEKYRPENYYDFDEMKRV